MTFIVVSCFLFLFVALLIVAAIKDDEDPSNVIITETTTCEEGEKNKITNQAIIELDDFVLFYQENDYEVLINRWEANTWPLLTELYLDTPPNEENIFISDEFLNEKIQNLC